jgi:predicted  nucleic acid-binding Zn-ribbon protein
LGDISLTNQTIIFNLPKKSKYQIDFSDNITQTGNKIEVNPKVNFQYHIRLFDDKKESKYFYFHFSSKNTELIHSSLIKFKTGEKSSNKSSIKSTSQPSNYCKIYFNEIGDCKNVVKIREEMLNNKIRQIVLNNKETQKNNLKEMHDEVSRLNTSHYQQVSSLNQEVSRLKQEVSSLKQEVSSLKQEVSSLKQEVSSLKQEVSSLKQEVSRLKQEDSSLNQEDSSLNQEVSSLYTSHQVEVFNLQKKLFKIKEENIEIKSELILMSLNICGEKFESG